VPLLAEAISRMRDKRVSFSPGYDGLFGTVQIFTDQLKGIVCLGSGAFFLVLKKP
jgi:hypothetical protein